MNIRSINRLILCSAFALFTQTTTAQNLNNSTAKNIALENRGSNYMAFSDFTPKRQAEVANAVTVNAGALKENAAVRSLYMSSEQYVFDNLGTLKRFFSVADIYFDVDQSAIRADALPVLDNLVYLMMEHPEISVATTSYSDTRYAKYNEKLALSRAQAANAYLISKGIASERLLIEKHGRPQLANPCNNDPSCSLTTQQLNRKAEFNIVLNGVNLGQTN